jgi:hypothetical protein
MSSLAFIGNFKDKCAQNAWKKNNAIYITKLVMLTSPNCTVWLHYTEDKITTETKTTVNWGKTAIYWGQDYSKLKTRIQRTECKGLTNWGQDYSKPRPRPKDIEDQTIVIWIQV